ncbi:hypothetical protein [Thalassospira mesophila]|nr:hypothetical protein [Thalassospira mesophila]
MAALTAVVIAPLYVVIGENYAQAAFSACQAGAEKPFEKAQFLFFFQSGK